MAVIRQSLLNCVALVRDSSTGNLFWDYFAMFREFFIKNYYVLIEGLWIVKFLMFLPRQVWRSFINVI